MRNKLKIYTVSQVNTLIKVALEETLPPRLIIRGEMSDWKHHTSGHCYFSLKDENGILPSVMWASKFAKVRFSPENGMAVLATGHIDVYTVGGKYQLYVDKLEPEGIGALQLAFEQMYKRLKAEGLFEEKYKKPLPKYPMRIGILTSESGAAVHDIRDSIFNRWPSAKLFLYPVPVQGEAAAEEIATALRDVNRRNEQLKLDILIVGRGGGALEDLWAFNEEVLARAIFNSKIPIVSAVGHEVDVTIADLVADVRASTPTRAGVIAVPDMQEVLEQLAYLQKRLESKVKFLIHNAEQISDELCLRLSGSVKQLLAETRTELYSLNEQMRKIEPHRLLAGRTVSLNNLLNRAGVAIGTAVNRRRMELTAQENRLAALNPKSVLERGYSITSSKKTGLLVRKPGDVQIGDYLITELAPEGLADKNLIESKVTKN